MKVVLLTTDTPHHTSYASAISRHVPLAAILLEERVARAPFETGHPFESLRDAYERAIVEREGGARLADIAPTRAFASMRDADALAAVRELAPDIILVFGTGRLPPPLVDAAGVACLNLHGGNPEYYRGLDTHLWAIYHDDFENLVTTLHYVDQQLDAGDIVLQSQVPLAADSQLHELRLLNTRVCVDLSLIALRTLDAGVRLPRRRQLQRGRYYSFMPAALKEVCQKTFAAHAARL